jgi:V8-like Glu-specific endopeptidase
MKIYHSLLVLGSLILSAHLSARIQPKVIYGDDNRQDVFESTNASFVELSKSTAAMISGSNLKSGNAGETQISGSTLRARGVCAKERFSAQISAANCSGFLVADNLLVTAGHCIKSDTDCKSYKWVFDYKVEHADQAAITVPTSSVYSCSKIISRSLDRRTQDDYALIQLDREVTDRNPVKFRRSGKVAANAELVVIGHPTGLPTKIADDARVRRLESKYFVANLDTYGGNSGSAVFNVETEEVEGILVRGETDYVYNSSLGCQESYRCANDGCRGEDVTYITNISELKKIR